MTQQNTVMDRTFRALGVDRRGRQAARRGAPSGAQVAESGMGGVVHKGKALVEWVQGTRIMRGIGRYGKARGGLLAGGIAYSALFAITAALTISWTVFMATLGRNAQLRETVVDAVNAALPGILQDSSGEGLINPDDLILSGTSVVATIIAGAVLLWTAMSIMAGLSTAIGAMFGVNQRTENGAVSILFRLAGFVVLGLGILTSAIIGSLVGSVGTLLLTHLGLDGALVQFGTKIAVFLLAATVDALVIMFIIRFTSGIRVPRRDFITGAALGALLLSLIRVIGTSAVSSVSGNPLLAPFAAIATLLLWLNLASRIVLMVSAYMANPPRAYVAQDPEELRATTTPNYVTLSVPETLTWPHDPITGSLLPEPDNAAEDEEEELPEWGGLAGNLARRRAEKLESKAREAQLKAEEARAHYVNGQRELARSQRKDS
ncbi:MULTISPECIES: YihY/virulence factor BrkB family protein [Actinotignum]|uniref:YihY/virulence factor BrkB family protein n=1 Tax=Actinotignum TaxID=1653174 RepID=UPI00254B4A9F|nr:YihY/virulence factor BrkB family protein [Actinotignum schaalii]